MRAEENGMNERTGGFGSSGVVVVSQNGKSSHKFYVESVDIIHRA